MSRCFPFPPPGYENKPPIEHLDLLAKEKPKEKKHKKEKKDKTKREGKDKKDKDKSRDKRKEKKDRKEKHKDRKKDKDRDKDKRRTSNEVKNEERVVPQNGEKVDGSSQKAADVKDSKYAEELDRRIRNEEKGVANRVLENSSGLLQKRNEIVGSGMPFSSPAQRRSESVGTGNAVTAPIQNKNETFSVPHGIETKDAGTSSANSLQRRTEIAGTVSGISVLDKRRIGSTNSVTAMRGSLEKGIGNIDARTAINDSFQKRIEAIDTGGAVNTSLQKRTETMGTSSGQKRNESKDSAKAADKERGAGNKLVANHVGTEERRNNGMGRLVEKDMDKRIENAGSSMATAFEKERATGNKMVPNLVGKEEKGNSGLGKQVETDAEKRIGAEDKAKADRHRDKDQEVKRNKSKHKDKDKNKEKDKDKMRQRGEQNEKAQGIIKNSSKKDLVDSSSVKQAASHIDNENSTHVDGSTKKRKDFEINGALHENDVRPNKLLKAASPHPTVQNGRTLEAYHNMSSPNTLIRHETSNSVKAAGLPENRIHKANGITGAQTASIQMRPSDTVHTSGKGEISIKPPHRDCKYLSQVYSVPRMEEFSENDDQSWLFTSQNCLRKQPMKLNVEEIPQVWAQAMHIDSADVFALPYVIPY